MTRADDPYAWLSTLVGTARRSLDSGVWRLFDQREEDLFATLIGDYDPMHNEVEWAEGVGLRVPVVLGVHVLSTLPVLLREAGFPATHDDRVRWSPVRLGRVRIPTSLPVGGRFRSHSELLSVERDNASTFTVATAHRVEIESLSRPFLVVEELVSRFAFAA
jgi:acyl dehydratase